MAYPVCYSQHSDPSGLFRVTELLHFADGTVAEHCTKTRPALLATPSIVFASSHYLQSWQDINPSISNVSFSYQRIS